ncbi:MAG: coenzyme F420-0:L-glutamate ligase [Ornithinimicrobium sp.]
MSPQTRDGAPAQPPETVTVVPLTGIPEITPRDDLAVLLRDSLARAEVRLRDGDVVVVSSKVVSKAQGLRVPVAPGGPPDDRERVVGEHSRRVVAERLTPSGLTRIVASEAGPVMAAAGVDASNTGPSGGSLLLPPDPDLAARTLYADLLTAYAPAALPRIGVVLSDTAGRAWREGQVDFALGACGVSVLDDLRGLPDADGSTMSVTARAVADEIAAAADLVKGKRNNIPAALVRGLGAATASPGVAGAAALLRDHATDWFRFGTTEAVRAALGAAPGSAAAREVGIARAGQEQQHVRLRRAIDLALLDEDPRVEASAIRIGDDTLEVAIEDPFRCGRVVARLEVALHSEDLQHYRVHSLRMPEGASAPTSGGLAEDD